jgi:hypothetical protein
LSPYFGGILGFVKENEPLLERGQKEKVKVDERRIQQLVRGFSNDWKKSIEELNQDIMHSFTNFRNGTTILQVCCVLSCLGRSQSLSTVRIARL